MLGNSRAKNAKVSKMCRKRKLINLFQCFAVSFCFCFFLVFPKIRLKVVNTRHFDTIELPSRQLSDSRKFFRNARSFHNGNGRGLVPNFFRRLQLRSKISIIILSFADESCQKWKCLQFWNNFKCAWFKKQIFINSLLQITTLPILLPKSISRKSSLANGTSPRPF